MKRFLFATLLLFATAVVAGCAHAATLNPSHTGHYYDPAQTGQGLELHVTESGLVLGTFFLGRVPGWYGQPTWLSAQGRVNEDNRFPLYASLSTVFGEENPLVLGVMGEVQIYALRDECDEQTCLVARVTIDGRGVVPFSPAPDAATAILYLKRLL